MPLPPSPMPMMISTATVSSIAILLLDTYRGRNFRHRPALLSILTDEKTLVKLRFIVGYSSRGLHADEKHALPVMRYR